VVCNFEHWNSNWMCHHVNHILKMTRDGLLGCVALDIFIGQTGHFTQPSTGHKLVVINK